MRAGGSELAYAGNRRETGGKRGQRVAASAVRIRRVRVGDIAGIAALDRRVTGLSKVGYWREMYERYGKRQPERIFLVAESVTAGNEPATIGFIVGEVRAWEFGSAPCGWVIALSVDPDVRLQGVGEGLFGTISSEFRQAGVNKMRTMVARDNTLHLMFFRSEGMMAGPYIQLEKELE